MRTFLLQLFLIFQIVISIFNTADNCGTCSYMVWLFQYCLLLVYTMCSTHATQTTQILNHVEAELILLYYTIGFGIVWLVFAETTYRDFKNKKIISMVLFDKTSLLKQD